MRKITTSNRPTKFALAASAAVGLALAAQAQDAQQAAPPDELEEQGVVANVLSRLLTTPTTRISIGGIDGVLSTNAVIHNITISDPDGVWLVLDRAALDWSLTALLRGRLQVRELTLDELRVTRRPQPTDRPEEVAEGPVFPELPVEVIVEAFNLERLVLEEPVLGTPAEVSAAGSAQLVSPEEGLQLDFQAQRLDAPGTLAVDFSYAPGTNILRLGVVHDEPEGGIVARLLDLPGLPPVQLRVSGEAPLEAFAADLNFQAGPTIGAQGAATVSRVGQDHQVDLDVAAQIAGLLPEAAAPLFEGATRLTGQALFVDGGGMALEGLVLESEAARAQLAGSIDAQRQADLQLAATTIPGPDGTTLIGETRLGGLDADLRLEGALAAPRITGRVDAAGIVRPEGAVETLTAQIDVTPEPATPALAPLDPPPADPAMIPDETTPASRFRFDVVAQAAGLAPTDPALANALGGQVELEARGLADLAGITEVEIARIATPTLSGTFTGLVATRSLDGLFEASVPDLSPFADLAPGDLQGTAALTIRLSGDPLVDDIRAEVEGGLSEFASGVELIDGLLGPQVAVSGAVRTMREGFAFEALRLAGGNLEITTDGAATQENADLVFTALAPRLELVHERIEAGRAEIEGRLTGSLERPNATASATLSGVEAMGRPIEQMTIAFEAQDVTGALDATLSLDGAVGEASATGEMRVQAADGGYRLAPIDLAIGSVGVEGDLFVREDFVSQGELRIEAGDLDDLSPLLLMELAGAFEFDAALSARDDAQDAVLRLEGPLISVGEINLEDFRIDATGEDVLRQPRIDGVAEAGRLSFAGQTFTEIRLTGEGTAQATDFSVSAVGDGAIFEADGQLMPSEPGDPFPRLDLQNINLRPVDQ